MELGEIKVFLVISDELHFGRTAERVGLSQSRVSQLVRTLERRIGAPLLERTSRRVTLTPLGARLRDGLLPAYAQLLAVVEQARSDAAQGGTVLRIGCAGATGGRLLTDVIETYRAERPGSRVVLTETPLTAPYAPLQRRQVDMMVARLPLHDLPPGITVGPVIDSDERLLAVPADHPVAVRGEATLEDLADLGAFTLTSSPPHLTCPFVPLYTPSGRLIPRRHAFSSYTQMLELVAQHEGAHPLAASLLRFHRHPGVAFVPIPDLPPVEVALLWPAEAGTTGIGEFVDVARRFLRTLRKTDRASRAAEANVAAGDGIRP